MKTLAISNAKGGTGKTTLAVHLAAGLAAQGKRTLLVDIDPQANATQWLLGTAHPINSGTAEALIARRIGPEHLQAVPGRERLSILPAAKALAASEPSLSRRPAPDSALRAALRSVCDTYDYAIIDCPPAAGFFVVSALVAADAVVVPILAAFLSLTGLARLQELVADVREGIASDLSILGCVLFAADQREAVTAEARETVREAVGPALYQAEIRVSTAAKALPANRATAWDNGSDVRGREDYEKVLHETLARLRKREAR
jgi:chromosome partitioning protein